MGNDNEKSKTGEAAKEAAKSAVKQAGKSALKKMTPYLIKIVVIAVLILAAVAFLFGLSEAIGEAVQKAISAIIDFFTIDTDGAIIIEETQIDTIINSITGLGVDMEGLKLMGDRADYNDPEVQEKNQEALRKYVKKFFEAQAVTQTLNTKPGMIEGIGKIYGAVYVNRVNENSTSSADTRQLDYISYEEMKKLKEAGNYNTIKNYFSTNPETGKLVVAGWSTTTTKVGTATPTSETTIVLREIDYKNAISQYTTSTNFFIFLTMISQNPEFAAAVTDLIKDSKIQITIMDTKDVSTSVEEYSYTLNTKEVPTSTTNTVDDDEGDAETQDIVETTEITTTSVSPMIAITYARTWFCEQTVEYTKNSTPKDPTSLEVADEPKDETEDDAILSADGSEKTWKTNKITKSTTNGTTEKYEETLRGDVIDKTGEIGDGNSSFIGLMDVKFRIPNQTGTYAAGDNIVSGAEWLFSLLQKDPASQNLEQIMRYILYKYTGKDYGVTQLDFSMFDAKEFRTVGARGLELLKEYVHTWENAGGPPTNADGTKYIIEDDGAGHPTVGYGVDIFNGGFAPLFQSLGYPTEIGGEVDKEFVDGLEEQELQSAIDTIKSVTAGLDLTEYQIQALVSRTYNCGPGSLSSEGSKAGAIGIRNGKNFVEVYNAYWNKETDDLFEQKVTQADFNHNLYTLYMSIPVTSDGQYMAGLERRRKSEWTLFQTGYYDVLNQWYLEGGDIIAISDEIHQYMEENSYTYCVYDCNGGEECQKFGKSHGLDTTFEESMTGHHNTCCATFVSWVLQEAGYLESSEHTNGAHEMKNILLGKGWIQIFSTSELEPGDVLYYSSGHVEIYAGEGTVYNAGSGDAIRRASPYAKNINSMTFGLRAPN